MGAQAPLHSDVSQVLTRFSEHTDFSVASTRFLRDLDELRQELAGVCTQQKICSQEIELLLEAQNRSHEKLEQEVFSEISAQYASFAKGLQELHDKITALDPSLPGHCPAYQESCLHGLSRDTSLHSSHAESLRADSGIFGGL